MREELVVDTNVPRAANGDATHASIACQIACIDELERIVRGCRILLDSSGLILEEYGKRLRYKGAPGVGDQFFRWVWDSLGDEYRVRQVAITQHAERTFEEFPADSELIGFDIDDRKFVATVVAGGRSAQVVNAVDSDWRHYEALLTRNEIFVRHLCSEPNSPHATR